MEELIGAEKELIWVEKEFAAQYKTLTEDAQRDAMKEYLQKCSEQVKRDYQSTLENMKDDAAMFRGLMIEVRKEFEKFANEHLEKSYELWENYNNDLPRLKDKVKVFVDALKPITNELRAINEEIHSIDLWQAEKLINTLNSIAELQGKSKDLFDFLVQNYKTQERGHGQCP